MKLLQQQFIETGKITFSYFNCEVRASDRGGLTDVEFYQNGMMKFRCTMATELAGIDLMIELVRIVRREQLYTKK